MATPAKMHAVLLTGHGGTDKLEYRTDVSVPAPGAGQVLIRVRAAGVNNTDINTRIGWYSKSVSGATDAGGIADPDGANDAGWGGTPLSFPRIQGADVCGIIESVGDGVDAARIGERVIVRSMMRSPVDYRPYECSTIGSEFDGGFAQFVVTPAVETHAVDCAWSDAELASIPCAYSTAENLLHRGQVGRERVLITGASGGVGSAAIQLAKRRGATVTAVSSPSKAEAVRALGADRVIDRNADLVAELGGESTDVVVDVVAGPQFPAMLEVLRRGGRYVTSGGIAGPIVELDVRTLYLKDLTLIGCTFQEDIVFTDLVGYIEAGEIRPVVAKTYPLAEIATAQADFVAKKYPGKLVLIPPPVGG